MTDDPNPYAAPQLQAVPVTPLTDAEAEAERIRRQYLNHEASVQSIGWLYYLAGAILTLGITIGVARTVLASISWGQLTELVMPLAIGGGLAALAFIIGHGLQTLTPQARFPAVILSALSVLGCIFLVPGVELILGIVGIAINAYVLYLLLSPKATIVFSARYAEVRRQTPHIRYRMGLVLRIAGVILLVVIGLGVVGGILAVWRLR